MAVTADMPYGGVTITGAKLTVVSAYIKQWAAHGTQAAEDHLIYQVEVLLSNGAIQRGIGWDNVKAVPDLAANHDTPLAQAEAAMRARLSVGGATNIVTV